MNLASAPAWTANSALPASQAAQHGCLRRVSIAEASRPAFIAGWQELAAASCEPNPFFEPWFALPSFEHFTSEESCAFFARYEGERLTGLAPVARKNRYYGYPIPHLVIWLHENAFCGGPLVARGFEQAFWRDLFAHFDAAPRGALFLHLPELPAEGPLARALDEVLAASNRRAVTVDEASRAMLSSDLAPQAYFEASMSAKKRKELRRQHKRLGEEGALTFERIEDAAAIEEWIDQFLTLEAAGWKGNSGSALASAGNTRGFFTAALQGAASVGKLERLALRLDGKPIAMLANFIAAPGAFSFKTAFDENYARYSPGLLLQIENLDLLARKDIEWTDSCAAPGHSMIERIWREKRRFTARNIAIGGPLRRTAFRALMAYETRGRGTP